MSSRAVDLNLFPDPVHAEDASDGTGSLGSLSAKSRVPGPDDQIRFSDLVRVGPDSCRVIMTQKGTKRVCSRGRLTCPRRNHTTFGADRRAPVGFYVGYQASNGDVDGLCERPWASDKVKALREADMAEGAARLAALLPSENGGVEESKEVEVETVEDSSEDAHGGGQRGGTPPGIDTTVEARLLPRKRREAPPRQRGRPVGQDALRRARWQERSVSMVWRTLSPVTGT